MSAGASADASSPQRAATRRAARSVFWILLAVFTATMSGLPDNTDAECEFQTTSALARTGSFALGGTPAGDTLAAHPDAPVRIGTDGRAYSWFGVGQAVAAVPLYAAGRALGAVFDGVEARHAATTYFGVPRSEYFAHLLVGWRNPLLSALTAALVVVVVARLGGSRRAAWLAGTSYGLASYAWPQARSTLSDVQAAFCVFAAFALLLAIRRRATRGEPASRRDLALFGLALGMAFLTRSLTAPALAVLVLAAAAAARPLLRQRGWKRVLADAAWAAAPALACIGFYLATNLARFGDPLESGYGEPLSTGRFFSHPLHLGLAGLVASPGRGLVWMAPLVLLAPLGLRRAWRGGERLFPLVLAGVVVCVFTPVAKMSGWHGAWTYGPRYVLPALPFLWVAAWLAFDRAGGPTRLAFAALAALGVATTLPGVLVDHATHQELALQAAELEYGARLDAEGLAGGPRAEALFQQVQWDWGLAAPWAHWRLFRHRVARSGEEPERFPARQVFFVDSDARLGAQPERSRGWRHLWWVDLRERLGGAAWPGLLLCAAALFLGVRDARRALAVSR